MATIAYKDRDGKDVEITVTDMDDATAKVELHFEIVDPSEIEYIIFTSDEGDRFLYIDDSPPFWEPLSEGPH